MIEIPGSMTVLDDLPPNSIAELNRKRQYIKADIESLRGLYQKLYPLWCQAFNSYGPGHAIPDAIDDAIHQIHIRIAECMKWLQDNQ